MTAETLRGFADRIATAPGNSERELFAQALALFADHATVKECARWKRLLRLGAFNEMAVAIYRTEFAECGFQVGAYPAGVTIASSGGFASTWRAGDAHASIHRAATPALALLRAAATEKAGRIDAQRTAQCSVCGGLGWFVTSANRKQICSHQREAA